MQPNQISMCDEMRLHFDNAAHFFSCDFSFIFNLFGYLFCSLPFFFSQKQNTFVHIQHIYLINIQNWLKRFNIILNKSKAIPFNFSIRLICFILIVWCQNSNIVYGKRASVLFFLFFKKGLKGLRLKIFVAFFRFFVLLEYFRCW